MKVVEHQSQELAESSKKLRDSSGKKARGHLESMFQQRIGSWNFGLRMAPSPEVPSIEVGPIPEAETKIGLTIQQMIHHDDARRPVSPTIFVNHQSLVVSSI